MSDNKLKNTTPATLDEFESRQLQARRRFIAGVSMTAAASLPMLAFAGLPSALVGDRTHRIIEQSRSSGLPDAWVRAHDGGDYRFYQDLVGDRVVLINFMSIARESALPITAAMASLVGALGDRIGRDIHAYSISYDAADTPERLASFAARHAAPKGWRFVSASPEAAVALGYRLYRSEGRFRSSMHADLIHYGNAGVGLWGTMSSEISDLDFAVMRVSSVLPGAPAGSRMRRAGPRRIEAEGSEIHHRDRTAKV
ncbi:MAG: hypothetical protein CVV18_05320 [Gammaproteobacteria bacterium HGW-Gammaproteobacteria-8]|nr:MAG: hypothetical protein CVV18_05320 [Gammaproteobacteria bacterium HGW-Gammaproteobacteria-8]